MTCPAVSVIIPCYNAEAWIAQTLDSVLLATSQPAEVIVVDDGSTDQSSKIVEGYAGVRLIRSQNRGVSTARNLGLQASEAASVVFLDADDLLEPGCLDSQLGLQRQSGADVVYGDYQRLEQCDDGAWKRGPVVASSFGSDPGESIIRNVWRPAGGYLFRRSLVVAVGGFEPAQSVLADCRFYFECAVRANAFVQNRTVCCLYRVHRRGQSMATQNQRLFFDECLRNLEQARQHWDRDQRFDGSRRDAYLRVLDFVARGSARRYPDLFAATCASFEGLTGGRLPFGRTLPRWAALVVGYRRYRWLQSLLFGPAAG
jgi:glycosyltransferase involved in cell wall biosynthesis